jgi:hypothetical protein
VTALAAIQPRKIKMVLPPLLTRDWERPRTPMASGREPVGANALTCHADTAPCICRHTGCDQQAVGLGGGGWARVRPIVRPPASPIWLPGERENQ